MGVREWILPREKLFFDLLQAISLNLVAASRDLCGLVDDYRDVHRKRVRLKEIEHLGDEAVHEIFEALNRTFVTPFDRDDIVALTSGMDNVLDMIYAGAVRLDQYNVVEATSPMVRFADIIREQCKRIDEGVGSLRDRKSWDRVEALTVEINRLENEADDVLNAAVADLFHTTDPITIIKLKDVYESLEKATDYAEDVADSLSDIVVKYR